MADEEKSVSEATVHVDEEKSGRKIQFRMILIYFLILAVGLFVGILFAYLLRG